MTSSLVVYGFRFALLSTFFGGRFSRGNLESQEPPKEAKPMKKAHSVFVGERGGEEKKPKFLHFHGIFRQCWGVFCFYIFVGAASRFSLSFARFVDILAWFALCTFICSFSWLLLDIFCLVFSFSQRSSDASLLLRFLDSLSKPFFCFHRICHCSFRASRRGPAELICRSSNSSA